MANKSKQRTATAPQNGNEQSSLSSLLDLSTTIQRRFFTVDSKRYELRSIQEFSLAQQKGFARHGKVMSDGIKNEDESTDDVPGMALNDIIKKIVVDGEPLVDLLNDTLKLKVLNAFLESEGLKKQDQPQAENAQTPTTSESQDSSASTEAAQATG